MSEETQSPPAHAPDSAPAEAEGAVPYSPAYSNYVLGILFVAYVFNFIDRQIPAMLVEPIKADLGLSDTQMGFLTGTAFAIFYATLGIPIARLADTWSRRNIISIGFTLWSAMTAISGLVVNFAQMAAARIGVGVGEAALSPPAHSLLASYFPLSRRATALSIYAMGIHVGILFGALFGDFFREVWGWRMTFLAVGLPGIPLALLLYLTVREPPQPTREAAPPVSEVLAFLWRLRSFRHASIASALSAFGGYAFVGWAPTYLERVHGMVGTERGIKYGLVLGIGGALGSLLAGFLADRLGRSDMRWWLWIPSFATIPPLVFTVSFFFSADPNTALLLVFPGLILSAMYQGPVFATVQTLVRERMRSVASGILLFIINIIGLSFGPPVVGFLNDNVFAHHGDEAIRYSMASVLLVSGALAMLHFLLGARTLRSDLRVAAE